MSALTGEFWVCAGCRSINNARAAQCYNCRTPRDLAEVDPATIESSGHGQVRPLDLPVFRPSRGVAALASVLLLAIAGIEVVDTVVSSSLMLQVLAGTAATSEQLRYVATLGILAVGIAALALIGWSLWLSRAVRAMPALGLGYPATSPSMAFAENFLPVLNLLRVPPIVRDVVHRVQPTARRTGLLIFSAWIALLVGFVVPRIVVLVVGDPASAAPDTLRTQFAIGVTGAVMVIAGSIVLVALIWWVEDRITASRTNQVADAHAAQAAGTASSAPAAPDAVELRSAFAAIGGAEPVVESSFDSPEETAADGSVAVAEAAGAVVEATDLTDTVAADQAAAPTEDAAATEPAVAADDLPDVEPEPAAEDETASADEVTRPDEIPAPPGDETAAEGASAPEGEAPTLVIRVASFGLMMAELDGQAEPVILDDLAEYAAALANVGGTASIVVPDGDGMADLIGRRVQAILEDAGVVVTDI